MTVTDSVLIDNQINIFTFIINPTSTAHEVSNKKAIIQNSLIVGQSPTYDCINDVKPNDLNFRKAKTVVAYGAGPDKNTKIGLVWPNIMDHPNGAPVKPW